VTVKKAFTF